MSDEKEDFWNHFNDCMEHNQYLRGLLSRCYGFIPLGCNAHSVAPSTGCRGCEAITRLADEVDKATKTR